MLYGMETVFGYSRADCQLPSLVPPLDSVAIAACEHWCWAVVRPLISDNGVFGIIFLTEDG